MHMTTLASMTDEVMICVKCLIARTGEYSLGSRIFRAPLTTMVDQI